VRADEIGEPGYINDHVIRLLNEAPLVIADLFGNNPNVFYEMAVRHTLGKPLIPIAEKGALIPFDVRGIRTVFIDIRDLESFRAVDLACREPGYEGSRSTGGLISFVRASCLDVQ
jgi:hypothetical protein